MNNVTKVHTQDLTEANEKALALLIHLGVEKLVDEDMDTYLSQVVPTDAQPNEFTINKKEYLVLTEEEADTAATQWVYNYIDEHIYPNIPKHARFYFDDDRMAEDIIRHDGRGSQLNTYDGCEYYEDVNGTTYYIYRTN